MILVTGEALMDLFGDAVTPRGQMLDARVGGSPFNVAVGLARMGQAVGFLGALSTDFLGARLLRTLVDEGVDVTCVQRVDAPTTLALVGSDSAGVPSYAFLGNADRQLGADAIEGLPPALRALHLGSFATVVEPVASTLRLLLTRLDACTVVSYDPNVRLTVEPDITRWRAQLDWMLPRTHLLKISAEDLALMRPDADAHAFAAEALQRGVRAVVVTRGAQGASGCTASATVELAAPVVRVVDTVGAGDTYQSALLTWLAENERLDIDALAALDEAGLRAAMRFAAAAAAVTCTHRGADLPRRGEI